MKMGNTSLSIIPVPNFYMNRTLYEMETFKIRKKKNYFVEEDLFKKTKDLNLSNNPRLNLNKFENFNDGKSLIILSIVFSYLKPSVNLPDILLLSI